ncbi:MAG: S16 family serine protease [archaeon]
MKKILAITLLILLISVTAVHAQNYEAKIDLPAVASDGSGVLTSLEVEVVPGKGRVLLTISPFTGIQTQNSEITAVSIAGKYTDFDFSNYDVIFTINAGGASVIDGPSAGAAMAIAVIAAVEEKEVREDAGITGTIQQDGSIGPVGGVLEKAQAAAQGGDTIFLIPKGTAVQPVLVEKIEEPAPGWVIKRITTEYIDITKTLEEDYNILVKEVGTIQEAVEILLEGKEVTKEPEADEDEEENTGDEEIDKQIVTNLIEPMEFLADWQINNAELLREDAKNNLANPKLDQAKSEMLQSIFSSVDIELSKAKQAYEKGYLYGAANYAFRAGINAKYVRDLAAYYVLDDSEKILFVGDRITETTEYVQEIKKLVKSTESLSADRGAYEWAVAAQSRIIQAETQLEERAETNEGIMYSLATIDSWTDIANNFIGIAKDRATGKIIDLETYKNKSTSAISRAEAELAQFGSDDGYGADWFLKVAKNSLDDGWLVAAYMDASVASTRLETMEEINTRGWSDLVSYIDFELEEVDVSGSAWGTLYRDYGKLVLHTARTELDVSSLKESLVYARQAELFSELSKDYTTLPEARFGKYSWIFSKSVKFIGVGLGIILVLSFMSRGVQKSFGRSKK